MSDAKPSHGPPTPRVALDAALTRARDGDRAAFAELYQALAPDVERLCRRLLGSAEDARDARNEIFLRAQARFARYDGRQPFRRWLLAVGAHHCIDQLRRRTRERALFDAGSQEADALPAPGPSPLAALLGREQRQRLLAAIDRLPDRYRVPLVLRYYADLPYQAIGELLDVSAAQVGSLLLRGRTRLRRDAGTGEVAP